MKQVDVHTRSVEREGGGGQTSVVTAVKLQVH